MMLEEQAGPEDLAAELEKLKRRNAELEAELARERERTVDAENRTRDYVRGLVEKAAVAILAVVEDKVVLANPAAVKAAGGGSPAEIIGLTVQSLFQTTPGSEKIGLPPDSPWTRCVLRRIDGSSGTGLVSRIPFDYRGVPAEAWLVMDVTVEEGNRRMLRRYEQIINLAEEHMAFIGPDYVYLAVNDAFVRTFGKSRDRIVGRRASEVVGENIAEGMKELVDRCLAGEEIHHKSWLDVPGSGLSYREFNYYPYKEDDLPAGAVIISRDATDRKLAEEHLRETNAILEKTLDVTHTCIALLDPRLRFIRVNRAFARAGGRAPGGFGGARWFDLMPDEETEAIFGRVVRSGESYSAFSRPMNMGGERDVSFWDWTINPIRSADGSVESLVFSGVDVTDRWLAEERLRLQAQFLDSVRESVVVTDLEGRVTYWGKGAESLYGYAASEVKGRDIKFIVPPGGGDEEEERMRQVMETGYYSGVYRQVRKNGEKFWAEAVISLVHDAEGRPTGFIGIDRDITARREAEEELRASEAKARALLDATDDAVALVDYHGRIITVNETFAGRFGMRAADIDGRWVSEFFDPDLSNSRMDRMRQVFETGDRLKFRDMRSGRHLENTLYPVRGQDGAVELAAVFSRDVTDQVEAQKQVTAYQDSLRALATRLSVAEEKERRNIAVDLHDGLGQILATAQIKLARMSRQCRETCSQCEELEGAIDLIRRAARETRALTCEIHPPSLYDLGLNVALDEFAEHVGREHGLSAEMIGDDFDGDLDPDTRVAVFRLARELMLNVVKHARATQMTVRVLRDGGHVVVEVSDNGVGFEPEAATGKMGHSLGLRSVGERLNHLGGRLQIDSEPGKGSRVSIRVPVAGTDKSLDG